MLCPTAEDLGPISGQSCFGICRKWAHLAIWGPLHMSAIVSNLIAHLPGPRPVQFAQLGAYWEGHAV